MTFRLEFISKCLALRPQIFRRLGEVADPSAGEARLTDKILKGFFFQNLLAALPSSPLSIHMFLSLSFSLSLSKCTCAFACLLARARKAKSRPRFFWGSEKRIQKCCEKFSFGDANCPRPPPIKKDIRVIRISTREVSVSEGGTFEK